MDDDPYDDLLTGKTPMREVPIQLQREPTTGRARTLDRAPAPPASADPYADLTGGTTTVARTPAVPDKQFGELKPADPSYTQALKWRLQEGLSGLGAPNYTAQRLGNAAVDVANMVPVMGSVLSGADLTHDLSRGNYGHAALDAIGVLPLIGPAARLAGKFPTRRVAESPVFRDADYVTGQTPYIPTNPGFPSAVEARQAFETAPKSGMWGQPVMQPQALPASLESAKNAQYRFSETSPLLYHPDAVANWADEVRNNWQNPYVGRGTFNQINAPQASAMLEMAENIFPRGSNVPIKPANFEAIRQHLKTLQGADGKAARDAGEILDEHTINPQPGMLLRGTAADLADQKEALLGARGNYRALQTGSTVDDAIDYALQSAAGVNSGKNQGNKIRQGLNQFVTSPAGEDRLVGAFPSELDAIANAAKGDAWTNALRSGANRLPSTGWGMTTTAGGVLGGTAAYLHWLGFDPYTSAAVATTAAAVPSTVGGFMRGEAARRTEQAGRQVAADIARDSPLYKAREAVPGMEPVTDPIQQQRDAISYWLLPQARDPGSYDTMTPAQYIDQEFVPYENR